MLSALVFVPAYVAWQERVTDLRDRLWPVPKDGLPAPDWYQARQNFEVLLSAQSNAAKTFAAAFSILAPLAGSLVSTLLPT